MPEDVQASDRRPWIGGWPAELEQFPRPCHVLTLSGAEGRGKTRIAVELAKRALASRTAVIYWQVEDLLSETKSLFSSEAGPESFLWRIITFDGVLFLDEAWTNQASEYGDSVLSRIVRRRLSDLRPTVVMTNQTEDQLRLIEPRLVSRMTAADTAIFLPLDGPDLRQYYPQQQEIRAAVATFRVSLQDGPQLSLRFVYADDTADDREIAA